jgi:hypothetical protein
MDFTDPRGTCTDRRPSSRSLNKIVHALKVRSHLHFRFSPGIRPPLGILEVTQVMTQLVSDRGNCFGAVLIITRPHVHVSEIKRVTLVECVFCPIQEHAAHPVTEIVE